MTTTEVQPMTNLADLSAALSMLTYRQSQLFGIEQPEPLFMGTVRAETEWLADYDAFTAADAERTLAWLDGLWNRADVICAFEGNSPFGYTARDIRTMTCNVRDNIRDMRDGIARGNEAMARDAYALLTTGLLANGDEA